MALRSVTCKIFSSLFLKIDNHEQSLQYITEKEQASQQVVFVAFKDKFNKFISTFA